jgi:hypothetical protein
VWKKNNMAEKKSRVGEGRKLNNLCRDVLATILTFFGSPKDWRNLSMTCTELHEDLTKAHETLWGMINIVFVIKPTIFFDPTITQDVFTRIKNAKFKSGVVYSEEVFSFVAKIPGAEIDRVSVGAAVVTPTTGVWGRRSIALSSGNGLADGLRTMTKIKELQIRDLGYRTKEVLASVISALCMQTRLQTLSLKGTSSLNAYAIDHCTDVICGLKTLHNVFLEGIGAEDGLIKIVESPNVKWVSLGNNCNSTRDFNEAIIAAGKKRGSGKICIEIFHGKNSMYRHSVHGPKSIRLIPDFMANEHGEKICKTFNKSGQLIRSGKLVNGLLDGFGYRAIKTEKNGEPRRLSGYMYAKFNCHQDESFGGIVSVYSLDLKLMYRGEVGRKGKWDIEYHGIGECYENGVPRGHLLYIGGQASEKPLGEDDGCSLSSPNRENGAGGSMLMAGDLRQLILLPIGGAAIRARGLRQPILLPIGGIVVRARWRHSVHGPPFLGDLPIGGIVVRARDLRQPMPIVISGELPLSFRPRTAQP